MKTITVHFEDEDFERLKEHKGNHTWREFILTLVEQPREKNER